MLTQAKVDLIMHHPFFATLALHLPSREGPVPTIGTDGKQIIYNRDWCEANKEHLPGLIAHEVLHVALGHLWRQETRDKMRFNVASDYAINPIILSGDSQGNNLTLPEGVLINWAWVKLSAEEIYNLLPPPIKISVNAGDHSQWGEMSAGEKQAMEGEWKLNLAQAAAIARQKGCMPMGIEALVEAALYPKVDWQQALAQFVRPTKSDYSFSPPDRRYANGDIVLPDFNGETVEDIVIAIDTSGSIWDDALSQFLGEVKAVLSIWPNLKGHLLTCDAAVGEWYDIDGDYPPIKCKGRGGTSFIPVFEEVAKRGIEPACLIYLTDLYGDFPEPPSYPVLWVVVNNKEGSVPFGVKVDMEV